MWKIPVFLVVSATIVACASSPSAARATSTARAEAPASAPASLFARIPAEIESFRLTERAATSSVDTDSLYRFRDSSRTNVTVFVYDVPSDVQDDEDPRTWTIREGEKFRAVQDIRKSRGQIVAYVLAVSDTSRLEGNRAILEHVVGSPTRYPNGTVTVEFQYLYLIGGRFVKVRATVPEQGWHQTRVPVFARALALRLARGA